MPEMAARTSRLCLPLRKISRAERLLQEAHLFAAIILEVCGTTCLKLSEGFTRVLPSIGILMFYGASLVCLTLAVKVIEIGVAYAIWSAVGVAVIALIGVVFFHQQLTPMQIFFLVVIVAGVIGLRLAGGASA